MKTTVFMAFDHTGEPVIRTIGYAEADARMYATDYYGGPGNRQANSNE